MFYNLTDISIIEFYYRSFEFLEVGQEYIVDLGHDFTLDKTNNAVKLVLNFRFRLNEEVVLARLSTGFAYTFENIEAVLDQNDNNAISKEIQRQLYAISVGTTRGIFFAKTEGNNSPKLFIPIINPTEQIPD